jgi:hypothetical protein
MNPKINAKHLLTDDIPGRFDSRNEIIWWLIYFLSSLNRFSTISSQKNMFWPRPAKVNEWTSLWYLEVIDSRTHIANRSGQNCALPGNCWRWPALAQFLKWNSLFVTKLTSCWYSRTNRWHWQNARNLKHSKKDIWPWLNWSVRERRSAFSGSLNWSLSECKKVNKGELTWIIFLRSFAGILLLHIYHMTQLLFSSLNHSWWRW